MQGYAAKRDDACDYVMFVNKMVDRLTPEQLALSEERRLKRQQDVALKSYNVDDSRGSILHRRWIELPGYGDVEDVWKVKVLSWNVCPLSFHDCLCNSLSFESRQLLAQCLVRE